MPLFSWNWAALAALGAMAAVQMYSPAASADGGGAGIIFSGTYSDDDDEDDAEATDEPTGYTAIDWRAQSLSFGGFTVYRSAQLADPQEETTKPLALRGLYVGYSSVLLDGLNLYVRPEYRFPSFDEAEEPAQTETPEPVYQLWVGYKVLDGLTLNAEFNSDLETLPTEEITEKHGLSTEGEALSRAWMMNWVQREQARRVARQWLGDDAYNKIHAQFGPANIFEADDTSAWNETYLYCGGECVAAGY